MLVFGGVGAVILQVNHQETDPPPKRLQTVKLPGPDSQKPATEPRTVWLGKWKPKIDTRAGKPMGLVTGVNPYKIHIRSI